MIHVDAMFSPLMMLTLLMLSAVTQQTMEWLRNTKGAQAYAPGRPSYDTLA
jgi:hypothetical protein